MTVSEELHTLTLSISHDLRAPLRAVDGFALELQLDEGSALSERGLRYVDRIRAASARMSATIDALFKLVHAADALFTAEEVDLSAIARAAAHDLAEADPERAIDFVIAEGLVASADPDLLRVVLDNLLGNAVKFTVRSAAPRIEIGAEGSVFFVRDNGVGFDPRFAERLFLPFQRLHPAGEFEGSGVGLTIVRRIVERHGGRVWATTGAVGATFYFTLAEDEHATPVR
ncbi:MAG TPA: ATP-binding protein [Thermoanaerobaculia bacterium]|jgi:signal transduction histidine kinase|nr:ATP-binding protein [Thermoanaerobaculia bacterium]